METLNALIIDDEPLAHNIILKYAADLPQLNILGQFYSSITALQFLKTNTVDLLFLDIQMPKLKGLELLRMLNSKPLVIITSAYEEYALESFELEVCDYLLKPFRFERFLKAVNKVEELKRLKAANLLQNNPSTNPPIQQIFIKSDRRHIQLNLADIYYIESFGNYIKIWLKDKFHLSYMTLSAMQENLPQKQFIRIHKSYIVHTRHIHYLEGNQLFLNNEKMLAVGRNFQKIIKDWISSDTGFRQE